MASKKKSGGAKSYPFATVRLNGVKCRATDFMPVEDAMKEIEAQKKRLAGK